MPFLVNEASPVNKTKTGHCELFVLILIMHLKNLHGVGNHQRLRSGPFAHGRTTSIHSVEYTTPYSDIQKYRLPLLEHMWKQWLQIFSIQILPFLASTDFADDPNLQLRERTSQFSTIFYEHWRSQNSLESNASEILMIQSSYLMSFPTCLIIG